MVVQIQESLVFGAVFCVSAFMAGRDYLAAKGGGRVRQPGVSWRRITRRKSSGRSDGECRGDNGSGESGGVGRTL